MIDLGVVHPGSTQRIAFDSNDGATGASAAASNFADADILVYKDGSTTQTAGGSCGGTATASFDSGDGLVGINLVTLNLADNTTAGWWAAGSEYIVVIGPITVDTQTIYHALARFKIGYPSAVLNTTIATLSTQTSFTLTDGPAEDDAINGMWAIIHDVASAVQKAIVQVSDYTGSTKTVTLAAGATFTAAATDNISIMGPMPLQPTTVGRTALVASDGSISPNWADIKSPTTSVDLSGTKVKTATDVETDTADIQTRIPAALTANGNMKSAFLELISTILTEGAAGRLKAAFTTFFDIAVPVLTTASVNQTGDSYAIVNNGTYGNSALDTDLDALLARLTAPRATNLDNLDATISSRLATASYTAPDNASISSILGKLSGITLLANWLRAIGRKSNNDATAVNEINANNGTGTGSFDPTTDSEEALRDRGDSGAWGAAGADPWTTALPGAYAAGTAGYIVGGLATIFSGITSLANWLRALGRKSNNDTTAVNEINADVGAGAGTFNPASDSEEAIRDRGDAAWSSAASNPMVLLDTTVVAKLDDLNYTLLSAPGGGNNYNNQVVVFYDASNSDAPSVRMITQSADYNEQITIDVAPDFTVEAGDAVKIFVTAFDSDEEAAEAAAATSGSSTTTLLSSTSAQEIVDALDVLIHAKITGATNIEALLSKKMAELTSNFPKDTESLLKLRDYYNAVALMSGGGESTTIAIDPRVP